MKALAYIGLIFGALVYGAGPGYHVVSRIPIGGEGFWDYLTVDSGARRLYVSHGTHVVVVDIDTEKVVGDIPDTPGVHGIAVAPELNRGFISNGRGNTATIFDLKTLKTLGQVKTGSNPDGILYEPATKRVLTFNGRSQDATVFDAASGEVLGTIELGGKPEFPAADGKGRVFVNMEDTSEVVEIDPQKLTVVKRSSIKPCDGPSGMGLDAAKHRVFSVCGNKTMSVLDADAGQVIQTVPIGNGPDGAGFAACTGLAFSSNGEGTLTVVRESAPGKYEVAETVPTARGARTMAVDCKADKIFLPTAEFGPTPPPTQDVPRPRPVPVMGSFTVLVVGK